MFADVPRQPPRSPLSTYDSNFHTLFNVIAGKWDLQQLTIKYIPELFWLINDIV